MTSQDLCHTSRHFVTRHVMNSSHNSLHRFYRSGRGWQRFSYFRFIQIVVSLSSQAAGRAGSMKPICYTWVFISHHTDRGLSIMDGLLAWRFQNTVVSWTLQFLIISKKLDHGAVVHHNVSIIDSRNFLKIITRFYLESPSTRWRQFYLVQYKVQTVWSTLVFNHPPDAKYPPQ